MKYIILSLLIAHPTFTHVMEKNSLPSHSFLLSEYSRIRSLPKQIQYQGKPSSDIRESKDKFEGQLQLDNEIEKQKIYMSLTLPLFSIHNIDANPIKFLQYCYYQKFHENGFVQLRHFNTCLYRKCQKEQIDGYSALGAAIIAKETPIQKRCKFIQRLIRHGFKPTPKDIELAELILYDEKPIELYKTLLHLLSHSEINWSVLPLEIRKEIAHCMVELFKKDFWLSPETSFCH